VTLRAIRAAALLSLAPGLVLLWLQPTAVWDLRNVLFDSYQRWMPRAPEPAPVHVIDIDDESLARLGQWPWPRTRLAALVRQLGEHGAAAIALDVVFPEPDRLSPAVLAQSWPELRDVVAAGALRDFDREFAATLAEWPVVGGIALTDGGSGEPPTVHATFAEIGPDPRSAVSAFTHVVSNIPILERSLEGVGSFSVPLPGDARLRRLPLLQRVGEQLVPALALEALRVALGVGTIAVRSDRDWRGRVRLRELRVADVRVPVSDQGELWLHFAPPGASARTSAWRLLQDDEAQQPALQSRIRGQLILVGASATALGDFTATPARSAEAAVLVHAQALEQMTLGHFLSRPDWAPAFETLALVLIGGCAVWLVPRFGVLVGFGSALALVLTLTLAGGFAFASERQLLDTLGPVVLSAPAFVIAGLGIYLRAERERARVRRAFSQYLAPDMVRVLARDPAQLRLGGESREMTFLFSDVADFTALSEQLPAETLVGLVNAYLDGACKLVIAHGGTIDKIVGDAIHVLFNAPLPQPDHAQRAVTCALALDAFGRQFAAARQGVGVAMGLTRIGVNTGWAVVGNFGGSARFDYTAHGDAVNTAARLETANKVLGTTICVAASTAERCPQQPFRPVGQLLLRGKTRAVAVFEPVSHLDARLAPPGAYLEAFDATRAGSPDSASCWQALSDRYPEDGLVAFQARRVADGALGGDIPISGSS